MSVLLHLGKSAASGSLGLNAFNASLDTSGELCIFSYISLPNFVQGPGRTFYRSIKTYNSNGGSLTSHNSQDIP